MEKVIVAVVAISLLVGLVGAMGLYASSEISHAFEHGEEHYGTVVIASAEISSYAKRAEGHTMLYLTLHNASDKQKFLQRIASLRNQTSVVDEVILNEEAVQIVHNITSMTDELQAIGESLFALHDTEGTSFRTENHETEIRKLNDISSKIRESGVKLAALETQLKTNSERAAKTRAEFLYSIIIAISVAAVICAVALGFLMARSLATPLMKLKSAAFDIGKGNLETKIDVKSGDEIGDLAASFGVMISKLKESKKSMEDYSKTLKEEIDKRTGDIEKSKNVLKDYNKTLEKEVAARTADMEKSKKELEEKVTELTRLNKLTVGRELKMAELKRKLQELDEKSRKN